MAFNTLQHVDINVARQDYPSPTYHGQNIQVQIPRVSMTQMQYRNNSLKDGAGVPVHGQKSMFPQEPNARQPPTQSQANVHQDISTSAVTGNFSSSVAHATLSKGRHTPVDYQLLLLSLAEEYFAAAHGGGSIAALLQRGQHSDHYYKFIATGLGCLETVLKVDVSIIRHAEESLRLLELETTTQARSDDKTSLCISLIPRDGELYGGRRSAESRGMLCFERSTLPC